MTTIALEKHKWNPIRERIKADYGERIFYISWRIKETLGFTVRYHSGYDHLRGYYTDDIRLDFVDETAATFFRMKYL
jgi:hypothetical protein